MANDRTAEASTPHVLVVAESGEAAQSVGDALGSEFAGAIRIATGTMLEIKSAVAEPGTAVVLLGMSTLAANERVARALKSLPGSAARVCLALCAAGDLAAASRIAGDGIFDHYLVHPDPLDPGRLPISTRLALRLARSAGPVAARARPVLLMVEDDEFTQQLVAVTLDSQDVELVFESDGAAALERIRSVRPDLVLMDVMLPGRDGVELTQHLKTDPELAPIPVVMVTGEARRDILVRSMEAGAADFIVKPFTPDALIAKLGKFLPSVR